MPTPVASNTDYLDRSFTFLWHVDLPPMLPVSNADGSTTHGGTAPSNASAERRASLLPILIVSDSQQECSVASDWVLNRGLAWYAVLMSCFEASSTSPTT